jgi:hypothetical protein
MLQTMKKIDELDAVVLTQDMPEQGLERGDVGTVVLVYGEGQAFEVEFVGYDGHTVALVTVDREAVRPMGSRDLPHVRELAAA